MPFHFHPTEAKPRCRGMGPTLLLVLLIAAGCNGRSKEESTHSQEVIDVKVSLVETQPWERVLTVLGTLESQDRATLSTKTAGRLKVLHVDVGTPVHTGDVLAQIEPRDYELRVLQAEALLAQARARLGLPIEGEDDQVDDEKVPLVREAKALFDEAQAGLDRVKKLLLENISSQAELERATAEHQVTFNRYHDALQEARERRSILAQRRAEYEIARQQLTDTSLRAPFAGVVQQRLVNAGEYLPAGSPVVAVVQVDPLRVRLPVPERQSAEIRVGQTMRVGVDGDTNRFTGRIARVSPALDERQRLLLVEGELKNPGHLRPGAFVRAEVVTAGAEPALAIPADSLVTFAGTEKAFVVVTNTALERRVVTGRRLGSWVEVLGGLTAGESVIRSPGGLSGGSPVRIIATPTTGKSS